MRRAVLGFTLAVAFHLATIAQTPPAPATGTRIQLRAGLTIVTAVADARGDYESIKRVTSLDSTTMVMTYSTDRPPADDTDPVAAMLGSGCQADSSDPKKGVHGSVTRTVRREDLDTAHSYRQRFNICGEKNVESYPGTTALGLSSAMLKELNTQGQTRLTMMSGGLAGALSGLIGGLLGGGAPKELSESSTVSGVLKRVERGTVPFKVIVNDVPVELPAVHATGDLDDDTAEFWILDDPQNPLSLKWVVADRDKLQAIKITFPPEETTPARSASASPAPASSAAAAAAAAGAAKIEHDLAETGTSVVYGIYFDFASDQIKPESDDVLDEIATVMRQHPTWVLSVDGHTDAIGGATANLDLSKRRAAAVRQALAGRYKIDPNRLQTGGYGASRPKDTNETIEGRARNRRVELRKISGT
jgi:outer membrane protein OmpA-like peptidoglycan-associated protein